MRHTQLKSFLHNSHARNFIWKLNSALFLFSSFYETFKISFGDENELLKGENRQKFRGSESWAKLHLGNSRTRFN